MGADFSVLFRPMVQAGHTWVQKGFVSDFFNFGGRRWYQPTMKKTGPTIPLCSELPPWKTVFFWGDASYTWELSELVASKISKQLLRWTSSPFKIPKKRVLVGDGWWFATCVWTPWLRNENFTAGFDQTVGITFYSKWTKFLPTANQNQI